MFTIAIPQYTITSTTNSTETRMAARNAYSSVRVTCSLLFFIVVCLHLVAAIDELHQPQQKHYHHQHHHQRQRHHQDEQEKHQLQQQQQQQPHLTLDTHNFLVGIAQIGAQFEGGSTQCGRELEMLLEAIASKQFWSLKMVDSFGAVPHSFYWGNYFWFSAQDLCDDLYTPYSISLSDAHAQARAFNATSPFPLEFTLIYLNFKSPYFIDLKLPFEYFLHLGLCLPRSCSADKIFNYTSAYFRNGDFILQRNFQLQLKPFDMRNPRFSWTFFRQTGSVLYICVCIAVIFLVIIAEILYKSRVHLFERKRMLRKPSAQKETETHVAVGMSLVLERIVMCFRLSDNYRRAIALDKRHQPSLRFLSAIAGLRTIVCLWVTVFHVYYYSLYAMSNAPMIFAKLEHFALQPIMQACFYVDVFFVMSAFLLVYNFLQNVSQRKQISKNGFRDNLKLYGKAVLYRYLRLTPVMLITMLLSDIVYDFLNMYSPFRLGENSGIYCKRNWWYNLLYIHNLLDMRTICCSWTWYLACEMQYFVLFTAMLYAYAKSPKVTKAAFVILAFGLVVISWLCNYRNGITFQIDVIHNTLNELYVKPWVRINPYIGGGIAGWLLHRLQQQKCCQERQLKQQEHHRQQQHEHQNHHQQHYCISNISTTVHSTIPTPASTSTSISTSSSSSPSPSSSSSDAISNSCCSPVQRIWVTLFWFSCFVLYVVTNFMSYWRLTPAWLVAAIMSFGKLLFALFIGAVIVQCALGRGGILQQLLAMRFLQFLNRFCFSIYMLAPVIVVAVFGLRREATNFTEVGSGMDFLAVIVLSIVSAFLLVLLVELPIQRISGAFLRSSMGGHVNMQKVANKEGH